jgi:hypothetical protein
MGRRGGECPVSDETRSGANYRSELFGSNKSRLARAS